ncbi:MAG: pheT [Candidatus Saccharibacteria bacterium]|nr:pheT [Candidatus Saccharibacteria bacterium]
MIISVNWLKKFTSIDMPVEQLATLIGERLVEIEGVENIGEKYQNVIVAKVVECAPIEGTDHLNATKIDDGGVAESVERDENGLVQVVCGAPNVRAGMMVAWLPPQSTVPETFHDAEPFVLSVRPLRGVNSNGMLASAKELDLFDDHTGILEVDKDCAPGSKFAEVYELDDYLLDIENKSLTHRPDAFGVIGFAREVAGIQGKPFITPDWLHDIAPQFSPVQNLEVPAVHIEDPALSDRFTAIVLSGINETAQSPVQLQTYLARSGVRPISASVDVSNYLMLLTGQPSHTYDYDKFKALAGDDFSIRVRSARSDEKLTLLDGKEITLDQADIVIAAGNEAVGLAGAMGGANTIVDETTKNVLLEVATFDLYHLRSTQMRHGIFSEAITRFTKGVPAPLAMPVLAEAVRQLTEFTGASVSSDIIEDYPGVREQITVNISEQHINETLGTHFSANDIAELLQNVGFEVTFNELDATVHVPYWREDIHIPEDIIEEVGRLAGFDTINLTLPRREFTATKPQAFDALRSQVRALLVRAGANEVLTYSFVHGDMLKKAGQNPDDAYRIVNSISPDLQYYRQSLTPNLLTLVHPNRKAGYDEFAIFECNKVHRKSAGQTEENVPVEFDSIALVIAKAKAKGDAFYDAKHYLGYVADVLGLTLRYEPLSDGDATTAPFEPARSAAIFDEKSDSYLGVVGEYKKSVQKGFKLPDFTAGFEINPRALHEAVQNVGQRYQALSRYPGTERDITFQTQADVTFQTIINEATNALTDTNFVTTIVPLGIYQAEGSNEKNSTIRIKLVSYNKTLTNEEVTAVIDSVIARVVEATKGRVI